MATCRKKKKIMGVLRIFMLGKKVFTKGRFTNIGKVRWTIIQGLLIDQDQIPIKKF